ncbi:hypothetical protein N657DRAFT_647909 [Parathielavia appendiculata]|uniref:Uncharacterized protein n=1 Tax=Parathielavia appendiculata TaxID=2587402 RepID=A0AAN6Z157_9PEZI|nr:hypothetical protein N657DRAFT_647909 [Parathielavia appendiculata]
MDIKKPFTSLLEDQSSGPGPSASALRPLSPFRTGRRSSETRSGDGRGTHAAPSHSGLDLDLSQDQAALSCVTKETSQEDCARHRFIVWAAVKRNSSVRMTPQERLECPLLRCTQRFPNHESMLKHLAGCRYLASGEYWCYDHMRVERFDDLRCKRCLGHPSKRRKMLSMAKNFFHSLGHKAKKPAGVGFDDEEVMLPPPPSYDSLNIPSVDGTASELPSTEIVEIDSMEVSLFQPTPTPGPHNVINPQALLMPAVPALPELDSTVPPSEPFMQWPPMPGFLPTSFSAVPSFSGGPQDDGAFRGPAAKPILQLATAGLQGRRQTPRPVFRPAPSVPRSKGLAPSSSVRSTASTDTNASMASNGSSMISPASNWSGTWSMASGLNTGMTSPVDGVVADDMFADALNGYQGEICPDSLHDFFSELPADMPMLDNACDMASSSALLGVDAPVPASLSYAPEIVLTDDTARAVKIDEPEVGQTNTCCSETKSLVSSAWDALQEHIVSSMVKLQYYRENYIANQLSSMSIRTVATTGLRTLRALINGQQPSSASDALCLVHLVYAFSLVLHEQETSARFNDLFLRSLAYANGLPSHDRNFYRQLVISIWQPPDLSEAHIGQRLAGLADRSVGLCQNAKGKSPETYEGRSGWGNDSLLMAARDFLDELEISVVLNQGSLPLDVQVSDLNITHLKEMSPGGHVNGALLATAKYVLETLSQGLGDACLTNRLGVVYGRLGDGSICSVRRIELEVLQAGKSCLPSTKFFSSFVPNVRQLCDQIYEQHDVGRAKRNVYHGLGVSLIESLIPEVDNSGAKAPEAQLDDLDAFFNDLTSEAGNTTDALTDLQPAVPHTFKSDASRAQLPTPTATSSSSGGTPSSAQTPGPAAAEQAEQCTTLKTTSEQQQPPGQQQQQQKVEANSCCEICGYRPKGDPQWFKGSMAKHKKLQHSTEPPRIYKCPYPGCTSQYKNRPDNLRQHQIEKNHWLAGDENTPRRPSKRKKVAEGE